MLLKQKSFLKKTRMSPERARNLRRTKFDKEVAGYQEWNEIIDQHFDEIDPYKVEEKSDGPELFTVQSDSSIDREYMIRMNEEAREENEESKLQDRS